MMGSTPEPASPSSKRPFEPLRLSRLHQATMARRHATRRSRIGRSGLVLALAAVVFVLLVMWLRDSIERQGGLRTLQAFVNRLAEQDAPWQWPEGYVSAADGAETAGPSSQQMVVLAYQATPRRLALLPDGHVVAVRVDSEIQARWMTRDQLARQLLRQGSLLPDSAEAAGAGTPKTAQSSD